MASTPEQAATIRGRRLVEEAASGGLFADTMLPVPYRIQRVRQETGDTFTLDLIPGAGSGATFAPGQFNMVYVYGVGEVPISISGDPQDCPRLQHTTRAVGTVTNAMRRLKRGEVVGIRGPFGSQWPLAEATGRDVVIVAGGVGLPPLRPALYYLARHRERYGRIVLLYGARTPDDILFGKELDAWRAKFDMAVRVTVDRASSSWRGDVGVAPALIAAASFNAASTVALLCGPEVMMRFSIRELERRGVAPDQIYISMERNMKCAIGVCGHCQFGPWFVCKDGPIFRFDRIAPIFGRPEV